MNLTIICGGISHERNISLNSARSVYDNVENEHDVKIIFINKEKQGYLISGEFLYSNTTLDFDFKLKNKNEPLSEDEFLKVLKESDLVFPVMHGIYAEDGQIQAIFEREKIKYVGSSSQACNKMYNKRNADREILKKYGFFNVPKLFLEFNEDSKIIENQIFEFFISNSLTESIIKPVEGGSSFGVKHARSVEHAKKIVLEMFENEKKDILIEKRCMGKEFTVIVLQNSEGKAVALIPTEIEVKDSENIIFDTRRKYLATNETHYHCPPRFPEKVIERIRTKAQKLFKTCDARDFLRIDGWLIGDNICFSDFNPISGMEQNSFIFQQGSKVGISHHEMIRYILSSAANRYGIEFEPELKVKSEIKHNVNVLLGGVTTERQVSLLSGSNVWLKLTKSKKYLPKPFLLYFENRKYSVIELPYSMVLYHTVEEILYQFKAQSNIGCSELIAEVREVLGLEPMTFEKAKSMTLEEFLKFSKESKAFVFIALHGGFGENGDIQKIMERHGIRFNGSGSESSKICMNKFETGKIIDSLNIPHVRSAKKTFLKMKEKIDWDEIVQKIGRQVVIKPNGDGCSTGVVVIGSRKELDTYLKLVSKNEKIIPKGTFAYQTEKIALGDCREFLIEEFIKTDEIRIFSGEICSKFETGWVELTVGVLEKNGIFHSFNPSLTVADSGAILSVEEKFQGGTGVNITPPPENIINVELLKKIKESAEKISQYIKINGYCRMDLFANNLTGEIIVIEINTLPGLTPSTVLFQQAANERPPIKPAKLLEFLIN
ncbi:MAG: hypothetical protein LBP36_03310 [Oscillospiraceae bacterium]|nr:hypothetical protein [Oscillospiraceae bacterium]